VSLASFSAVLCHCLSVCLSVCGNRKEKISLYSFIFSVE
jgi:hypothetical protein